MSEVNQNYIGEEESLDIRRVVLRYLGYWPWFLVSVSLFVTLAYFYLRYTNLIYATTAKVRIMDNKESEDFSLDVSRLLSKSSINLENEVAAFNSYRLSQQVVRNLGLHISYKKMGAMKTTPVYRPPFKVQYANDLKRLDRPIEFNVTLTEKGFDISSDSELVSQLTGHQEQLFSFSGERFSIVGQDNLIDDANNRGEFLVMVKSVDDVALGVSKAVNVTLDGKDSDVLQLKMESADKLYAQAVINELIETYSKDGVLDRQQVSLRTIAFVDERFTYLRAELDSIERSKKNFKERNSLSFIQGDVQESMRKRAEEDSDNKNLETQLLLGELLEEALNEQVENNLLPSNLGLNSSVINQLVGQYNSLLLEFEKVGVSAGDNNPTYKLMEDEIVNLKRNIDISVKSYVNQLKDALGRAKFRQEIATSDFKDIPEKEQILRSIEREQNLKESLYLLLLQKREEAAINLAVTVPNLKVIDYAITDKLPISPKRNIILLGSLSLGFAVPFALLYLSFLLDTKISGRDDIEKLNLEIPIVGEIPFVGPNAMISDAMDRSVTSEAFRITGSNIDYKLGRQETKKAKVIFVTSSMKGEGKTFVATNLALSYAYLNKKVLLLGGDLRNPEIHKYFDLKKSEKGVSDYLADQAMHWTDCIIKPKENTDTLDVMLSGSPSMNPAMLLANERFHHLMNLVGQQYDYVLVDTAPTLLVSDTQMIADNADLTVHVLRAGVTEKAILEYTRGLKKEKKLKNMTFILNAVGKKSTYGYGYGYGYNYGYGYGYGAGKVKKSPKYLRFLSKVTKRITGLF